MKKFILAAAFGTLAASANAQMRFGAEVGLQLANVVAERPEFDLSGNVTGTEHVDSKPNMGLRGGLVAQFDLTDHLSIQPGLLFVMKGFREEAEESETIDLFGTPVTAKTEYQYKLNLNYIEVPINFQYGFGEDGTGFFAGGGPYIGYGFAGKQAIDGFVEVSTAGVTQRQEFDEEVDVDFGNDDATDTYRHLDFGLGLNAGYMLPMGAFVRAFGQYGFSNIYNLDVDDYKVKHYGFGLTVGYMIGGGGGNY